MTSQFDRPPRGRSLALFVLVVSSLAMLPPAATAQSRVTPAAQTSDAPVHRTIVDAMAKRNEDREVTVAGRASVSSGKLQSSAFDIAIPRFQLLSN